MHFALNMGIGARLCILDLGGGGGGGDFCTARNASGLEMYSGEIQLSITFI